MEGKRQEETTRHTSGGRKKNTLAHGPESSEGSPQTYNRPLFKEVRVTVLKKLIIEVMTLVKFDTWVMVRSR